MMLKSAWRHWHVDRGWDDAVVGISSSGENAVTEERGEVMACAPVSLSPHVIAILQRRLMARLPPNDDDAGVLRLQEPR